MRQTRGYARNYLFWISGSVIGRLLWFRATAMWVISQVKNSMSLFVWFSKCHIFFVGQRLFVYDDVDVKIKYTITTISCFNDKESRIRRE